MSTGFKFAYANSLLYTVPNNILANATLLYVNTKVSGCCQQTYAFISMKFTLHYFWQVEKFSQY